MAKESVRIRGTLEETLYPKFKRFFEQESKYLKMESDCVLRIENGNITITVSTQGYEKSAELCDAISEFLQHEKSNSVLISHDNLIDIPYFISRKGVEEIDISAIIDEMQAALVTELKNES